MHENNELHIDKMTSKIIYRTLVQRIQKPPTSQVNYKNELNVLDTDWSNIYLMPFKASHDVRTRIFQYKINLNCLMTNSRLFKMKIVDNVNCSLCSNFPETLKHIFWDCTYATNIWDEFNMWFETNMNFIVVLDYKKILFGICTGGDCSTLINLCLILIKKVIYDSRFHNRIPSFLAFKYLIKFHYKLEKQISITNNTMYKFIDKWTKLEKFCEE